MYEDLRREFGNWLDSLNPFQGLSRQEGAALAQDLSVIYFALGGSLIGIGSLAAVAPVVGVFLAAAGVTMVLAGVVMVIAARRLQTPQPFAVAFTADSLDLGIAERVTWIFSDQLPGITDRALPFTRSLTAVANLNRAVTAVQRTLDRLWTLATTSDPMTTEEFVSLLAAQAGALRHNIAMAQRAVDILGDIDGTLQQAWDDLLHELNGVVTQNDLPDINTINAAVRAELADHAPELLTALQYQDDQIGEILELAAKTTVGVPVLVEQEELIEPAFVARLAPYRDELNRLDLAVRDVDAIARMPSG